MNHRKTKNKPEFSKLVFLLLFGEETALMVYACALMWYTQTTEALQWMFAILGAQVSTGVGFYFWKAKAENVIKISKDAKLDEDTKNEVVAETLKKNWWEDDNAI